jgi:outer membrane protein OmpA-like peptidoglycan-associated protein
MARDLMNRRADVPVGSLSSKGGTAGEVSLPVPGAPRPGADGKPFNEPKTTARRRMMFKRSVVWVAGLALVGVIGSTGCVTKKVYRKQIEETDARIDGVQTAVEANERRVGDLSKETDAKISGLRGDVQKAVEVGGTALTEAQTAQKLAKGKILWTVTLSDDRVKFGFDQASVPAEAQKALDDLANQVKQMDKAVYVEIEGHTDNIGSAEHNLQLGEQRADAVRNHLHQKGGIPLHAMNVISYGESRPVADNGTPQGRAQNRRVVVRVLE